jgi:hypothetical protein
MAVHRTTFSIVFGHFEAEVMSYVSFFFFFYSFSKLVSTKVMSALLDTMQKIETIVQH